ncbi:hypothetical protein TeGR_g4749, partial [Tetraparma gracilis]
MTSATVSSGRTHLSYGMFDRSYHQVTSANPKLRFDGLQGTLDHHWAKHIERKQQLLSRKTRNSLVKTYTKLQGHAKIKEESLRWTRPANLDNWELHKGSYEQASIPTELPDYRPSPPAPLVFASTAPAASHLPGSPPRPGSPVLPPASVPPPGSLTKPQLLTSLFASLSRFTPSTTMNSPSVRKYLLASLRAAVDGVNSRGGSRPETQTQTQEEQPPRPASAKTKSRQIPYRDAMHFGKPGAYMSPVATHHLAKARAKLDPSKESPPPLSPPGPNDAAALLKEWHRSKRENRPRPWTAPSRKQSRPASTKPTSFQINLSDYCPDPASCAELLTSLHLSLHPSQTSPALPFSLDIDFRNNNMSSCLSLGGEEMKEALESLLVHPGISGMDLRENDNVGPDEDEEILRATGGGSNGVQTLADSAAQKREDLRHATASPPLDKLLLDERQEEGDYEADFEEDEESPPHLVAPRPPISPAVVPESSVGSLACMSAVTDLADNQGYLADPKHKMEFNNYPGMPGESTLPSF